ncbi:TPA: hypothetical protein DCW54_00715 [Candidatus Dependentiae bacterium]|nr:hypothetical protein [Candidatus Dependentiae bacterium]
MPSFSLLASMQNFTQYLVPLFFAILAFGVLITVHEFGHFLFCKLFKVHTPTFSIGFGPTIIDHVFGRTNFRLALIPLGGYVEIAGMDEPGQGKQQHAQSTASDSFANKSWWQKALIILGGITGNLIFAHLLLTFLIQQGFIKQWCTSTRIAYIKESSKNGSLQKGDKILRLNEEDVQNQPQKVYRILAAAKKQNQQSIEVTYERENNRKKTAFILEKKPNANPNATTELCLLLEQNKQSLKDAAIKAFFAITSISKLILKSMGNMVMQRDASAFSGPVGIIQTTTKAAQEGALYFLFFVAIISINLAIFNLLPLPILDGGQLLIITLESLSGKSLSEKARAAIANLCWLLFLLLIIFATYQDIKKIFGW